jgi:hypothetical protein
MIQASAKIRNKREEQLFDFVYLTFKILIWYWITGDKVLPHKKLLTICHNNNLPELNNDAPLYDSNKNWVKFAQEAKIKNGK